MSSGIAILSPYIWNVTRLANVIEINIKYALAFRGWPAAEGDLFIIHNRAKWVFGFQRCGRPHVGGYWPATACVESPNPYRNL